MTEHPYLFIQRLSRERQLLEDLIKEVPNGRETRVYVLHNDRVIIGTKTKTDDSESVKLDNREEGMARQGSRDDS